MAVLLAFQRLAKVAVGKGGRIPLVLFLTNEIKKESYHTVMFLASSNI